MPSDDWTAPRGAPNAARTTERRRNLDRRDPDEGVSVAGAMNQKPEAPSYPPEEHIVRDLAPVVLRDDSGSSIQLPITPAIHDACGRVRVGAVATIVDIVAGETAIREVLPGWIATSNLSLHTGELPGSGTLRARPRILRHGKTTLVMEVLIDHLESGLECGLSTIGFAILPGKNETQARVDWAEKPEPRSEFGNANSGFRKPMFETLGIDFDPEQPARTRLAVSPYVINTLGAMQGGCVAILIDAAADYYAASRFGEPARVRSLEVHYLKLARTGPVRADVRELGHTGSGLVLRVSLHDEGRDDVLLTVATLVVDRAGS